MCPPNATSPKPAPTMPKAAHPAGPRAAATINPPPKTPAELLMIIAVSPSSIFCGSWAADEIARPAPPNNRIPVDPRTMDSVEPNTAPEP